MMRRAPRILGAHDWNRSLIDMTHVLLQTLERLRPSRFHAGQHLRRLGRYGADDVRVHADRRLAASLRKRDRDQRFEERLALPVDRNAAEDEPLRRRDLLHLAL